MDCLAGRWKARADGQTPVRAVRDPQATPEPQGSTADWGVHVSGLAPETTSEEIAELFGLFGKAFIRPAPSLYSVCVQA